MAKHRNSIEFLPLERLHFDPKNPRLAALKGADEVERVLRWMLREGTVDELMGSIVAQGYFAGEPVLVSPLEEGGSDDADDVALDQDFTVVEGNRRLAAAKLLATPEIAPIRTDAVEKFAADSAAAGNTPTSLPAIIFARREQILDYLGYRHITGVKEWDPLEKARYLEQLRERAEVQDEPASNRDLARKIGSTGPYVGRLLTALDAFNTLSTEDYFEEIGADEEEIPFSLLSTALNHNGLVDFLGLEDATSPKGMDDESLRLLARWMFEEDEEGNTVLGESRNIGMLDEVVQSEEALAALAAGESLQRAYRLTNVPADRLSSALLESLDQLKLAESQLAQVEKPTATDESTAQAIVTDSEHLSREISERRAHT